MMFEALIKAAAFGKTACETGIHRATDSLAKAVKQAAMAGCLLWTPERLTTTNASRIDARPGSSSYARCCAAGPKYTERSCALPAGHDGQHEHGLKVW